MWKTAGVTLGILLVAGCQGSEHPAMGVWQAELVRHGQATDLGQVQIGEDFILMPQADMRFRQLEFSTQGDQVSFQRQQIGNIQSSGSAGGAAAKPWGSIILESSASARLQSNKIQGTLMLER